MFRKTETMTIGEFMNPTPKKKIPFNKAALSSAIPLSFISHGIPAHAQGFEAVPAAAISDALKDKILHAFDPLIELMISLSYPIAGVMITGASLLIMIGQKDKGYSLIQTAGIGYILVQLSPLFLKLLVGIGEAV